MTTSEKTLPDGLKQHREDPFLNEDELQTILGTMGMTLREAQSSGWVVRMTPTLFLIAPEYLEDPPGYIRTAQEIQSPSYVTDSTALDLHGILNRSGPSSSMIVYSLTCKHSNHFSTPFGQFVYFKPGYEHPFCQDLLEDDTVQTDNIASPETALIDHAIRTNGKKTQGALGANRFEPDDFNPSVLARRVEERFPGGLAGGDPQSYLEDLIREVHDSSWDETLNQSDPLESAGEHENPMKQYEQ